MSIINSKLIEELRKNKGWDQSTLAGTAGIHRSVISRLERGLQDDLRLSVAIDIAKALNVSLESLLSTQPKSKPALVPELEAVISELTNLSQNVQHQAAGILRGYLNTLN